VIATVIVGPVVGHSILVPGGIRYVVVGRHGGGNSGRPLGRTVSP
jgi:hypothetical protein